MKALGNLLQAIVAIYLGIGAVLFFVSFISAMIFYSFGPGAFWNIGFISSFVSFWVALWFGFTRVFLWPLGVYAMVTTDLGFFQWLFYIWYAPR